MQNLSIIGKDFQAVDRRGDPDLVAADAARRLNLTRGCQADQAAFPGQPAAGRADDRFLTAGK
jgi:hypothetical protein